MTSSPKTTGAADQSRQDAGTSEEDGPDDATNNGHIESVNRKLRDERLNVHQFVDLDDARHGIEAWRRDDNEAHPHGALGHPTPKDFAEIRQGKLVAEGAPL
ncbi:MAG: transposase [Gemmatimonadales bacterium]|nr:transposase [Gemmatimonadales bacterium]